MARETGKVACAYRSISEVSVKEIVCMYQVFIRYYDNVELDVFLRDMSKKTGVFLMTAERDGREDIVGFSTVTHLDLDINGRRSRGIFSGDTIIEREFWGNRALQRAFLRYVVAQRLRNPFKPLYWFLISKGYKTYLLLANNYPRYYPNPAGQWPELAEVVRTYCEHLFPDAFVADSMLLDFGNGYQRLKGDVAAISEDMRRRHPKIAFFEARNPGWQRGTELPCVGELSFGDLLRYVAGTGKKLLRRPAMQAPEASPVRATVQFE